MDMLSLLLAVVSVGLAVALGVVVFLRPGATALSDEVLWPEKLHEIQNECAEDIGQIRREIEDLRVAIAHGIEHVERTERRIKSTVQRARTQLAESGLEHEGLEAEVGEISGWDGGGGPEPRVSVMPENVVPPQSSVPGVTPEQLSKVRGF